MTVRAIGIIYTPGIKLVMVMVNHLALLNISGGIADDSIVFPNRFALFQRPGCNLVTGRYVLQQRHALFFNHKPFFQFAARDDDIILFFQSNRIFIHKFLPISITNNHGMQR